MFSNLLEFLGKKASLVVDEKGEFTSFTLQVATAAVLWEVANSDDEYLDVEYEKIVTLLSKEFKLTDDEAKTLIEVAEQFSERGSIQELIDAINDNFLLEQKQQVMKLVMQVAQVDGALKTSEVAFVERLEVMLGLGISE